MNYYSISDDNYYPNRWFLGDINVEDNWIFTYGKPIMDLDKYGELIVEIDKAGVELDFTKTDAFSVPIISEALADQLLEYGSFIQLIPISIMKSYNKYYVLVIKNRVDCIDELNSDFEKFEDGNEIRPDKTGEFEIINKLKIDKTKVDKPIFRLAKYDIEIIIDETIKRKLVAANLKGLKFKLVS